MDTFRQRILIRRTRQAYHYRVLNTQPAALVAYYPMWDALASGTMTDYSGNGKHLTWGSGTSRETGGIDGLNCAYLTGTNTAIDASSVLAATFPTDTGTISVWGMNRNSTGAGGWTYLWYVKNATEYIRMNNQGAGDAYFHPYRMFRTNHNVGGVARELSGNWSKRFTTGSWVHMAYSWDGSAVTFYENGTVTMSGAGAGTWGSAITDVRLFSNGTGGEAGRFRLQHLGIWNVALTAEEIASLSR